MLQKNQTGILNNVEICWNSVLVVFEKKIA